MTNYIRGELYRLMRKKSLHIYFAALAVGYVATIFLRLSNLNGQTGLDDAMTLFPIILALVGAFIFAAVYTDDLGSKNLTTLVGFGFGKARVIVSKLILVTLVTAFIYAVIPLWMCGALAVFGHPAAAGVLGTIYALALKNVLAMVAYAAVASIVVYGAQRATFAIVAFLLFSLNIVDGILMLAFKIDFLRDMAPTFQEWLVDGVTTKIFVGVTNGGPLAGPVIGYAMYVVVLGGLSILAFRKKEMEF